MIDNAREQSVAGCPRIVIVTVFVLRRTGLLTSRPARETSPEFNPIRKPATSQSERYCYVTINNEMRLAKPERIKRTVGNFPITSGVRAIVNFWIIKNGAVYRKISRNVLSK